jgi:hypothetical protein
MNEDIERCPACHQSQFFELDGWVGLGLRLRCQICGHRFVEHFASNQNMKRKRRKRSFSLGQMAIPLARAILIVVVVLRTCFP